MHFGNVVVSLRDQEIYQQIQSIWKGMENNRGIILAELGLSVPRISLPDAEQVLFAADEEFVVYGDGGGDEAFAHVVFVEN